jgi:hypothetical protein
MQQHNALAASFTVHQNDKNVLLLLCSWYHALLLLLLRSGMPQSSYKHFCGLKNAK